MVSDPALIRNGHALAKLVAAIRTADNDAIFDALTRHHIAIMIADLCLPEHARISFLLACGVPQEDIRPVPGAAHAR